MVPLQRRHRHDHLPRPAAPCHRRRARPRDHLSNGRRQEAREEGVRNGDIDGDRRDVVRHRHRHRQARRTRAGCKGWSRRRSVQRVHVSVPSTCTGRGSAGDGIDGNAAARGVNKGAAGFTRGTGCCVCACVSLWAVWRYQLPQIDNVFRVAAASPDWKRSKRTISSIWS